MNNIDDEMLEYLDDVAALVASLYGFLQEQERLGDPLNEDKRALLALGEAYMYLYNYYLDNHNNNEYDDGK